MTLMYFFPKKIGESMQGRWDNESGDPDSVSGFVADLLHNPGKLVSSLISLPSCLSFLFKIYAG